MAMNTAEPRHYVKWCEKKTLQGYVVSNSTPKYWSMKFFFVEADAAPLSALVCKKLSCYLSSTYKLHSYLFICYHNCNNKQRKKRFYLHWSFWLLWLQFLLKHSHHLQPALVCILKEWKKQNTAKWNYYKNIYGVPESISKIRSFEIWRLTCWRYCPWSPFSANCGKAMWRNCSKIMGGRLEEVLSMVSYKSRRAEDANIYRN